MIWSSSPEGESHAQRLTESDSAHACGLLRRRRRDRAPAGPIDRELKGNHGDRRTAHMSTAPDRFTWSGAAHLRWMWDLDLR